jgi:hypothetical protein
VQVNSPTTSFSSVSLQLQSSTTPNKRPATPNISREDIEWAQKLDKKMELGWVPSPEDQQRYNHIVASLKNIRDDGGYVYQDTTSFSNNPRGIAAIGSLTGKIISGGYIGYRYSGDVAAISRQTYESVKSGLTSGNITDSLKELGKGAKGVGIISLKAAGISAGLSASISTASNIAEVVSGRQTGKEAVGNVAADTVGGILSGVGATVFSGISTLGMSLAGAVGLPITIAGVAGGVVGSVLLDKAYKGSGLFTALKNRTVRLLD